MWFFMNNEKMDLSNVSYTSLMKNTHFIPSRSVSRKSLFGAVFVVAVIIYFYINMTYSEYSTKIDYFMNKDDSEYTSPSMEGAIGYLLSNDASFLTSIENNIKSDTNERELQIYINGEDEREAKQDDIKLDNNDSNIDISDGDKSEANVIYINGEDEREAKKDDIKLDNNDSNIDISDGDKSEANVIYINGEDEREAKKDDIKLDNNDSNIDISDGDKSEANVGEDDVEKTVLMIEKNIEETNVNDKTEESPHSTITGRNFADIFVDMNSIEKSTSNIFFLETRCGTKKEAEANVESRSFTLNARQCCAVESTARMNPDRPVYVFHSCQLDDDFVATSAPYVGRLMNYENVHVVRLLPEEVFHDTPLEPMFTRGELEESAFPIQHASDLLRLALLWKLGGTYLDLDVVSMKPMSPLGINWFTAESDEGIGNAIFNVAPDGEAHDIMGEAMTYLNEHYDRYQYCTNGPCLLSKIVQEHCQVQSVLDAIDNCHTNLTVLPKSYCFPLFWPEYGLFFDENIGQSLASSLKEETYILHTWNRQSQELVARVGSQQAYSLLAEEFCPEVYANCGESF